MVAGRPGPPSSQSAGDRDERRRDVDLTDSTRAEEIYAPVAPAHQPPSPGLVGRLAGWLPLRPYLGARLGFAGKFDRAAARLAATGGAAVPARQAAFFFGQRLRLEIDPRRLSHRLSDYVQDSRTTRWIGEFFLDGGDWSRILSPIVQSPAHREVVEICQARHQFRDSRIYKIFARRIAEGQPRSRNGIRLDTEAKLDAYFQYYVDLVESIERTGILPRNRIGTAERTGQSHRSMRSIWQDMAEREIGVAIGPDGALVRHTSGKHRVAAAFALGLDRIPVEIRLVHAAWLVEQARRLGLPPAQALDAVVDEMRANRGPGTAGPK